jgi:competence protein ComGC
MTRGRFGLPARQRGQALVFIGVTTVIVLLGVILLFNVAQLTTQKMKLQNTADAAAYSGVVLEARDYNFSAYANRAMIANQVTVAQLIGTISWLRNLDNVYRTGPFTAVPQTFASLSALGAMWTTVWNAIRVVVGGANAAASAAGFAVKALDVWIDLLYGGSSAYHIAMVLTVPEVVLDVIKENDADASLSLSATQVAFALKHGYDAYQFTSDYDPQATSGSNQDTSTDPGGSQDRQANVIFNSQDGWYNFRSYPWPLPILLDPTKFIPGNFGTAFMIMYHSGGTEMKETVNSKKFSSWTALDATGTFVLLMLWIFVPFPIPIPIPIPLPQGSGAAFCGQATPSLSPASNNFNHNFSEAYGSAFVNPLTIAPAGIQVGKGPGANVDSRCGLKRYWDVTKRTTNDPNLEGPDLLIEVEKDIKNITVSTSNSMKIGKDTSGALWLPAAPEGDVIRSMSKAHAYFSRPPKLFPRDDGKTEFGSLYNPYWQARLKPNSLLEQGASIVSASFP